MANAHTNPRYVALGPKNSDGPTTPHRIDPLKCTRAIGHVNPLIAWGVHIPGTFLNIQLSTAICVREETMVATI